MLISIDSIKNNTHSHPKFMTIFLLTLIISQTSPRIRQATSTLLANLLQVSDVGVDSDATPSSYSSPLSDVTSIGMASSTSPSVDKGVVDVSFEAVGGVVGMSSAVGDEGVEETEVGGTLPLQVNVDVIMPVDRRSRTAPDDDDGEKEGSGILHLVSLIFLNLKIRQNQKPNKQELIGCL